jgi:hypothetical protein
MGSQILSFRVRAFLTCWDLTDKAPGAQVSDRTHCTAVRQIAYRTAVAHIIVIETWYANRAVYQMAVKSVTI